MNLPIVHCRQTTSANSNFEYMYAKLAAEEQSRGPQEEREQKFSVYEEEEHGRYGRPGANQEEEQKDEV